MGDQGYTSGSDAERGLAIIPLWGLDTVLHRAPQGHRSTGPQGSLGNPRKTFVFIYFQGFVGYFRDFGLNIKVSGQNNMFFQLLRQE